MFSLHPPSPEPGNYASLVLSSRFTRSQWVARPAAEYCFEQGIAMRSVQQMFHDGRSDRFIGKELRKRPIQSGSDASAFSRARSSVDRPARSPGHARPGAPTAATSRACSPPSPRSIASPPTPRRARSHVRAPCAPRARAARQGTASPASSSSPWPHSLKRQGLR